MPVLAWGLSLMMVNPGSQSPGAERAADVYVAAGAKPKAAKAADADSARRGAAEDQGVRAGRGGDQGTCRRAHFSGHGCTRFDCPFVSHPGARRWSDIQWAIHNTKRLSGTCLHAGNTN